MPALNWTISLLVGLGNPGLMYAFTRHNMGFLLLDALVKSKGSCWEENKKCKCQVAVISIANHKIYCIKPQTFMNLSGEAAQAFCHYFKLKAEEVLESYCRNNTAFLVYRNSFLCLNCLMKTV